MATSRRFGKKFIGNFPIYFFNELYIVYTYHPFCQALLNPYFSAKMAL